MTIRAIYEKGLFRPVEPVELPDRTEVSLDIRQDIEPKEWSDLSPEERQAEEAIYEVLSRRFSSGDPYGAERHNEHQP